MRPSTDPASAPAPAIFLSTLQWFLVLRMLYASVAKGQIEIAARLRLFRWLTCAAEGTGTATGEVYFRELLRDGLPETAWDARLSVILPADALPLLSLLESALERWLESGEGFQTGAQQWAILDLLERLRGTLAPCEVKPS